MSVIFDRAKGLEGHSPLRSFPIPTLGLQLLEVLYRRFVRVFPQLFLLIILHFIYVAKRKIIPTSFIFYFTLEFFPLQLQTPLYWQVCLIWLLFWMGLKILLWNWVTEMVFLSLAYIFCIQVKLKFPVGLREWGLMIFSPFQEFEVILGQRHFFFFDWAIANYYNLKQWKRKLEVNSFE